MGAFISPPKKKPSTAPAIAARTFGGAAVAACMQADLRDWVFMGPMEDHLFFEEALCLNHALKYR